MKPAARHRSPAAPPARHRSHVNFVVTPGLLPSILLSPQDCLQSCCRPRIEGSSTRNSTRASRKKRTCLFPVPNSSVMPVSSSELHAGSNQKTLPVSSRAAYTPARRVIRIIRIIRSYGGLALRHPAAPAWHRSLPGRACPA